METHNPSEMNCGVDVDSTLLMWIDEYTPGEGKVAMPYAGKTVYLTPHQEMIDLLIQHYYRGFKMYVWSMNGPDHAKNAVELLGLKPYVFHTMSKMMKHMDDKSDPKDIVGTRVYLEYKK